MQDSCSSPVWSFFVLDDFGTSCRYCHLVLNGFDLVGAKKHLLQQHANMWPVQRLFLPGKSLSTLALLRRKRIFANANRPNAFSTKQMCRPGGTEKLSEATQNPYGCCFQTDLTASKMKLVPPLNISSRALKMAIVAQERFDKLAEEAELSRPLVGSAPAAACTASDDPIYLAVIGCV